eukprot:TRINITY_DN32333_c0_g1_i1.p2 TRINITY_DN32333_c0_g1~~TRINITY_DN32333_c0_g1_i1.p2  ORF type:complete len:169 (+),score=64.81 TRINITY_DN32333_c0_g1_i1:63-569(+)
MSRGWQPPSGPIPLAGGTLSDEEKHVARLQASIATSGLADKPPPLPPGAPPPPPEPSKVEKLVGHLMSAEWRDDWKAWALENGVTPSMLATLQGDSEKPLEVMMVYKQFLKDFDKKMTRYCLANGVSEQELHAMCVDQVDRGGTVAHCLNMVLDQTDITSFCELLQGL